jgi:hypothetical protein
MTIPWKAPSQQGDGSGPTPTLERALATAFNYFSAENGSNTPDFILADFAAGAVAAFDAAVNRRAKWYGRHDRIGAEQALPLSQVREFVGFLSGAIPELSTVEVPRLAAALDQFLERYAQR